MPAFMMFVISLASLLANAKGSGRLDPEDWLRKTPED